MPNTSQLKKMALAFSLCIVVLVPSIAGASERTDGSGKGAATDFLMGRANNLYGIDPPQRVLIETDVKRGSRAWSEFVPTSGENGASSQSWILPAKSVSSEDGHCNGKSVDDFLNGKCNKLHGFDVKPHLPNANRFNRLDSFIKEAGGHAWHIYGDEGTAPVQPFFRDNRIYQRLPGFELPNREAPLFAPREQTVPNANPVEK